MPKLGFFCAASAANAPARQSDVAMAGLVQGVFAFGEGPFVAVENFLERKVIGGDVVRGSRETSFLATLN